MENKDFAIFILTHKRADKVFTYNALIKAGYTGAIFFIVDDEDPTKGVYIEKYGDKVVLFNKRDIAKTFDRGDNFDNYTSIVYARNACFGIAEKLGITYFAQLDDDYTTFRYSGDENLYYITKHAPIKSMDAILDALIKFYERANITVLAIAQGGDFIGGPSSGVWKKSLSRKAMNFMLHSIKRPLKYRGTMNGDVTAYTNLGSQGVLFFTVSYLRLEQILSQTLSGGSATTYRSYGTYVKSFYSVMYQPSSINITEMGVSLKRLHHKIDWKCTVPQIIDEKYKK